MFERNALGLAGRVVRGLLHLVWLVVALPVFLVAWWEASDHGAHAGHGFVVVVGLVLALKVARSAGRQVRELDR
jgi:hypothetical protein